MEPPEMKPEQKRPVKEKGSSSSHVPHVTPSSGSESSSGEFGPQTDTAARGGRGELPPESGGGRGGTGEIRRWSRGTWLKILALAVLLVGGYYFFNPSPSVQGTEASPNYKLHQQASRSSSAMLSTVDVDQMLTRTAMLAARAGQPIPQLQNASPQLLEAIKKGEVTFYRIRAYDTCDEDGDWVSISVDTGATFGPFMITNQGQWFSIPVVGNKPPAVTLNSIKDGVGGVTVGVQTSTGVWYSGVLAEGQTQPIPFSIR